MVRIYRADKIKITIADNMLYYSFTKNQQSYMKTNVQTFKEIITGDRFVYHPQTNVWTPPINKCTRIRNKYNIYTIYYNIVHAIFSSGLCIDV